MASLKLALIVCDRPIQPVVDEFGAYPDLFTTLFKKSFSGDERWTMTAYEARKSVFPTPEDEAELDGIVITGSVASAYAEEPWIKDTIAYTRRIILELPKIRVVGVCFGHQIISMALGGTCVPMPSEPVPGKVWEVGLTDVRVNDIGHELFPEGSGNDTIIVQQMHRDYVPSGPSESWDLPGGQVWCETELCHNQGMVWRHSKTSVERKGKIHVLTMQFHPEFTQPLMNILIPVRIERNIVPPIIGQNALKRGEEIKESDNIRVGKLIGDVLLGKA